MRTILGCRACSPITDSVLGPFRRSSTLSSPRPPRPEPGWQPLDSGLHQYRSPHWPPGPLVNNMDPSRPDLTISLISANNLDLLLPCLRSVYENTHRASLEVFLVDNASRDTTTRLFKRSFPRFISSVTRQGQGFSTNNNLVLHQGQGRYLMLLNDDTIVLSGAFDVLLDFADQHPDVAAVGPLA